MEETAYGLSVQMPVAFDTALTRTTDALKAEGFVILGACNLPLADRALHAELEIALLLPCNVIVYAEGPAESVAAAMAPLAALGIVGRNAEVQQVAREADERLRRALTSLEASV